MWHEEMKEWQRSRLEPWWAELVWRARADGPTILCTPLHGVDSFAGIARLVDQRNGLVFGETERFIAGKEFGLVLERWMDEARTNG